MANETINALDVLKGLISKANKLDDGTMAEIFEAENATTESVLAKLLELDTNRVSLLKKQNSDNKDSFNQGYAKAKKEERLAFENEIKESLEVASTSTGIDLINDIIKLKAPTGAEAEVTDDLVKKHPAYQNMERGFKKSLKEANENYTKDLESIKGEHKRTLVFQGVKDSANVILQELSPVMAKNPKVAQTIKNQFFNELQAYGYEQQEDGSFLATKDGKVVEDAHGHTVAFKDIVKGVAENYFEFQGNNGGGNAGNNNQGGTGAGARVFKNFSELSEYASDTSVPIADRAAAMAAWKE